MGGCFGTEGHRPTLIPTPEISKDQPMAALSQMCALLALTLGLGVGVALTLAGAVIALVSSPEYRDTDDTVLGWILFIVGLAIFILTANAICANLA